MYLKTKNDNNVRTADQQKAKKQGSIKLFIIQR